MKQNTSRTESDGMGSNRAVSPVIGVILMVAITVILAAVIGAFVLEIGDQQETAPSTSYDTEQETRFYERKPGGSSSNLTTVEITHAGGDTNDVSQTDIVAFGNNSIWGVGKEEPGGGANVDEAVPQPNILATAGTNEPVEFTSGESWSIIGGGSGSPADENLVEYSRKCKAAANNAGTFAVSDTGYAFAYPGGSEGANLWAAQWECDNAIRTLESGDQVNVVWEASSGGKTQTLQKYTVQ